jgi:hypothetical protein
MNNNAFSETGTDLSLDFHKELKNNNNNGDNILSSKEAESIKNNKSKEIQLIKDEGNKLESSGTGSPNIFAKEDNSDIAHNFQTKIPINNFNLNIKNYRLDNFKHLRNKFENFSTSTKNQKTYDFDKIFKNTNKEKNKYVINQINSLLSTIENIKTKTNDFSPDVKDSLLNSYKNFIAVKEKKKFTDGVSILNLKREEFLKNTHLQEVN